MHTALTRALLMATLLTVARSAAAVEVFNQPAPPPLDEAYLTALAHAADHAVAASQTPPDPRAISAIPEPPVYIMLLVGVGLLGLAARRDTIPPAFKTDQDA